MAKYLSTKMNRATTTKRTATPRASRPNAAQAGTYLVAVNITNAGYAAASGFSSI